MQVSTLNVNEKLDPKLEMLIDQFEKEVAPLDRWARISVIATSAGVVASVVLPLLLLSPAVALYATIGGIHFNGNTRVKISRSWSPLSTSAEQLDEYVTELSRRTKLACAKVSTYSRGARRQHSLSAIVGRGSG